MKQRISGWQLPWLALPSFARAVPGPWTLALPLSTPLHSPFFPKLFLAAVVQRTRGLGPPLGSLVVSRPACRFVLETFIEASVTTRPPPFSCRFTQARKESQNSPPRPWCYCRFRDARVLRNRVQVAWRRAAEADLQIAIWENGLAPLVLGCASTCSLWASLLADIDTAAGV